ncbi:BPSS1780 family membrane protein [Aquabacterium sp. OR-4]|uniref:BPSS1780 family membrane protein n=1 Tax=Aquabacterium sp. OR-4 TaxID=2978127 RepID=UPI0028C8D563|nr:BPSS1780 family membrane protein [Aquabacterium sp. OR-4]MDT7836381.1 BPSS1780 family membrane protein [Aquabacterium sp. OR-4]
MGLRLQAVPPRQGWQWIVQGFALWRQRPLAFMGLFVIFLVGLLLLALVVPVVGGAVGLGLLPLLTLGFMIASRSVLDGGPVHALQMIEGLRVGPPAQRRAQWLLCAGYMAGAMLVITLSDWADDGLFVALQRALAEGQPGKPSTEIDAILANPQLLWGMLVRLGLTALLSVPYWHAPALVHWGGQGALQALFSSTLAVWQARAAFLVYALAWLALLLAVAVVAMLATAALGSAQWLSVLAMPLGLSFTAVFYVSLWFAFADSFDAQRAPDGPTIGA